MAIINMKRDKSVKGRKAVLKQEISFFVDTTRSNAARRIFPEGTIVTAVHETIGTGLTTFDFVTTTGKTYQHVVREGKFEYID